MPRPRTTRHWSALALAVLLLAVAGGCARRGQATAPPTSGAIYGRSVEGRPLVAHRFGAGPARTVVIGGIHGDEAPSVALAERLVEELSARPGPWSAAAVLIVPDANPDGGVAGSRTNANGVDCNRNFPAANWRPARRGHRTHGPAPASEPEVQALLALLEQERPQRIVSIHTIAGGRHCNNFDGPGEALARRMGEANGYPTAPTIGYPTPGSLGSWAGVDRGIATITLELPDGIAADQAWAGQRAALLIAIDPH